MNCNVIQDLMILYSDNCCCDESKAIVEEHIKNCDICKKAFDEMNKASISENKETKIAGTNYTKINSWKASVIQSVLSFVSFVLLVFGVAREASTPAGDTNGLWAFAVIVPVTGFLLSLANWYFVRIYISRKAFWLSTLLFTVIFVICGYIWAFVHYKGLISNLFNGSSLSVCLLIAGCIISITLCAVSIILSDKYARLLGKE